MLLRECSSLEHYLHTCSDVRGSAYGAILINLCTILFLLYCIYIITHFVGGSEEACRAFAFLVHYFVLAACLALAITSFFTCFTPFSEGSKLKSGQVYLSAILLNWSKLSSHILYGMYVASGIVMSGSHCPL